MQCRAYWIREGDQLYMSTQIGHFAGENYNMLPNQSVTLQETTTICTWVVHNKKTRRNILGIYYCVAWKHWLFSYFAPCGRRCRRNVVVEALAPILPSEDMMSGFACMCFILCGCYGRARYSSVFFSTAVARWAIFFVPLRAENVRLNVMLMYERSLHLGSDGCDLQDTSAVMRSFVFVFFSKLIFCKLRVMASVARATRTVRVGFRMTSWRI